MDNSAYVLSRRILTNNKKSISKVIVLLLFFCFTDFFRNKLGSEDEIEIEIKFISTIFQLNQNRIAREPAVGLIMWLRPKGLKVYSYVEKYAQFKN